MHLTEYCEQDVNGTLVQRPLEIVFPAFQLGAVQTVLKPVPTGSVLLGRTGS